MAKESQSAVEAALSAKGLFQDKTKASYWPAPLVRHLEKLEPKLALRWAIQLFQELIPTRIISGDENQQQIWLADLVRLIDCDNVADRCDEIAHQIWHNDQKMNFIERGISRLYWALQNHEIGLMEPDYYLQVSSAVSLLADNGELPANMDESVFERGIDHFHRIVQVL